MNSFINKSMIIAVTLLTIAVILAVAVSLLHTRKIQDATKEIIRKEGNRSLTQQLITDVIDNETGARGYVITGKEVFLEPLKKSEKSITILRDSLKKNIVTPVLIQLLNDSLIPLIDTRIAFSKQMVDLRRENKIKEVTQLVLEGKGKHLTDEIRRIGEKMIDIRNDIISTERVENDKAVARLNLFLYTTLGIIFLISVFNFRGLIRFYKKQKETETELRNSKEIFSTLFYKSPVMKMIVEPSQIRILDVNESFCNFFGFTREELIGHTTSETNLLIPSPLREEVLKKLNTDGFVRNAESEIVTKKGETKWISINLDKADILKNDWIIGSYIDITAQKNHERFIVNINQELEDRVLQKTRDLLKNEEELLLLNESLERKVLERTAQLERANKEMESFSYSVSHDLRAPLRAIVGFSNILEEDYGKKMDDEEKRLFSIIKANTQKMGALIDDLLTFSRLGRKEIIKTDVDMQVLVQDVMNDFTKQQAIDSVKWNIHPLPSANADFSTMKQVWVNLIGNAIKYSRDNDKPTIEIGSIMEDDKKIFFVRDNGVGFDEKYKEKLFKVFQRLHSENEFEGTGIGLALVDKIITRHGGTVWAEGEVDKGACFYFSIP
ncbi:MAG: CHASE3 domain-containing protein [Lacibacter sp.]